MTVSDSRESGMMSRGLRALGAATLALVLGWGGVAQAIDFTFQPGRKLGKELRALEGGKVRIAYQFGVGYLPLMIMRQHKLIEKQASAMGLGPVNVNWNRYPSGRAMNSALGAGLLDIASGGVVPMVEAWSATLDGAQVRGLASLGSMPLDLVTNRKSITRLADFGDADRIAVPDIKESSQAVLLRMAAAKAFGEDNMHRLDKLMVNMSHPQGEKALLGRPPTISAHFTGPPFQDEELKSPNTHKLTDSYQIMQGASSYNLMWSSSLFSKANPRTLRAVYQAVQEAMGIINDDPDYAARVYLQQSNSPQSVEFIRRVITSPQVDYTYIPQNTMGYAEFLASSGAVSNRPVDWRVMFYDLIHGEPGS